MSMVGVDASLRRLPSVDRLAAHPDLAAWRGEAPALVVRACREAIEAERAARREGAGERDAAALAGTAAGWLRRHLRPGPRRVINATGVVLHTNLGRAPLGRAAVEAAVAAGGACDLELDLGSGRRGSRQDHVAPLLAGLCGAEDALVVTNNAAGVLLALTALCRGGEVLVSRGEAVEIGGGFRIPEVMRLSGARMVDVGTTNRTRVDDYAAAIGPRTRALVRVHPSNFSVSGFVERPSTTALAGLARARGLLLIEDCGSGALADPTLLDPGLGDEPVLAASIAAGTDLVLASGDKLCGGPQAGLLAGRADLVARMRRHPLMRALRPDKLVVAALGATLAAWLRGTAGLEIPVARMLSRSLESIGDEADSWAASLRAGGIPAAVRSDRSEPGGGSLPGRELATRCVALPGPSGRLLAALRAADPPVVARASAGCVLLDPRSVAPEESDELLDAVRHAWARVHLAVPGPAVG